ncbi:unnamed protein product [Vitrella brassicaformis CCMP3155]|uniref:Uncharacterized protein n=2 Tax=Vitrella brassicaformis TaxID=1169539 RepID=A0A0G4H2D9_VITBC|nr:unnamed protein product [Vitrella brassicaformis CCMP3155]|mmetsp:Transcript_44941/g.126903  ORF Transcript_44941/g.126903 Transcript_44941/m.126903 type:complete len:194 (+) Transcript_44941:61-642(+)|eukprot:CEM37629.1 unnamed protein product [Vitrella brassicaformis CCMP3155]
MLPVAEKYALFEGTASSLKVLKQFQENFEVVQSELGKIEARPTWGYVCARPTRFRVLPETAGVDHDDIPPAAIGIPIQDIPNEQQQVQQVQQINAHIKALEAMLNPKAGEHMACPDECHITSVTCSCGSNKCALSDPAGLRELEKKGVCSFVCTTRSGAGGVPKCGSCGKTLVGFTQWTGSMACSLKVGSEQN